MSASRNIVLFVGVIVGVPFLFRLLLAGAVVFERIYDVCSAAHPHPLSSEQ
jgi:hypothetical protein